MKPFLDLVRYVSNGLKSPTIGIIYVLVFALILFLSQESSLESM